MKNFLFSIYARCYDAYQRWISSETPVEPKPEIPLVRTVSELNADGPIEHVNEFTPTLVPEVQTIVDEIPEPVVIHTGPARKYKRRIQLPPTNRVNTGKQKKTQTNARRKNSTRSNSKAKRR